MPPYDLFEHTLSAIQVFFCFIGAGDEVNNPTVAGFLWFFWPVGIGLIVALLALLIPNSAHQLRRAILWICTLAAMPGHLAILPGRIALFAYINPLAAVVAAGMIVELTLWLIRRSSRWGKETRLRALFRILAVWTPMHVTTFLAELIAWLCGYQWK